MLKILKSRYSCLRLLLGGVILAGSLMLSSCEQRIDGTSDESFKASLEKIYENLSEEEAEEFTASYFMIGFSYGVEEARKKLDGLTVSEVNELAKSLKLNREKKEQEEAKRRCDEEAAQRYEEIFELRERIQVLKQQEKENARYNSLLDKIVLTGASFRREKSRYSSMTDPVVSFTIHNKTDISISRVRIHAKLMSEGRKVAWMEEDIYHSFRGGLEPGETQTLNLDMNSLTAWGSLKNRDDYQLILTPKGIWDENDEEICVSAKNPTEERLECEARLLELERK